VNKKGQAALEYLMSYGWALIVIAIVVGVLIVISGQSTAGIVCKSPTSDIFLQTYDVSPGRIQLSLQNSAGVAITSISASASGDFTSVTDFSISPASGIDSGLSFLADSNAADGPGAIGSFTNGVVTVTFTKNNFSGASTVNITCSGTLN
jgi:uncharacterized protein (UPF0333 family)